MKNLRYFYVDEVVGDSQKAIVRGEEAHHMAVVNRMSVGDSCCLINGRGLLLQVSVEQISKKEVLCAIVAAEESLEKGKPSVVVLHAMPRKGTFTEVIEKAVELGASRLIPIISERCMVKVSDVEKTNEKHMKVARAAMKQSHRVWDMTIEHCTSLKSAVVCIPDNAVKILMDPYEGITPKEFAKGAGADTIGELCIAIGPEGGFSDDEKAFLHVEEFEKMCFPGAIFRSETAIVAGLTVARFCLH